MRNPFRARRRDSSSAVPTGPVAIVDIGSNSIRLVVYGGLRRAAPVIFNEKVSAGLGKVVNSGEMLMGPGGQRTLDALRRFRALCDALEVTHLHPIATAAARVASDGEAFLAACSDVLGAPVRLLSGDDEARMAASGVISGIRDARGVVGDLGGGSLELVPVADGDIGRGGSIPVGTLALQAAANDDMRAARQICDAYLDEMPWLGDHEGQPFYAVGGTWRAIARLDMAMTDYPLRVIHQYEIDMERAPRLLRQLQETAIIDVPGFERISSARRVAIPFGAVALERVVKRMQPSRIVLSAFGVREGVLYSQKAPDVRARDPLFAAVLDLARVRSRSFEHVQEIGPWLDPVFEAAVPDETPDERRIRLAVCLLSDIGWLSHPEYRGEHGVNTIENANFAGISHPERLLMARAIYYRHQGFGKTEPVSHLRQLLDERLEKRARILGASLRAVHMISAAMPRVLQHGKLTADDTTLRLTLKPEIAALDGERLRKRFNVVAKELKRDFELVLAS